MKYTLKQNFRSHLVALCPALGINLSFLSLGFFIDFDQTFIEVYIGMSVLFLFPALYLHIEYWLANRNKTFIIEQEKIILKEKNLEKSFLASEIEHSFIFKQTKSVRMNPIENYYFIRISFKNGDKLLLTSILDKNLDNIFKGIKINREYKNVFFCSLHHN